MLSHDTPCIAFAGPVALAQGPFANVALTARQWLGGSNDPADVTPRSPPLVFDIATSEVVELDWRGSEAEFATRVMQFDPTLHQPSPPARGPDAVDKVEPCDADLRRGPGRPRLGVVAREVTLLPRHWEWLGTQPGGASVALRKLVEVALRTSETRDRVRRASEVGYRFMRTMAEHLPGGLPHFDEASRALFAGDQAGFEALAAGWPADVQRHLKTVLVDAFWA
jgi:uncharacterized protein